ncbi:MAG TPA: LCP family protein [Patescibacteria group bacterium]|nr:LCP family protein [Patescibacteria group bacterium]
MPDNSTTGEIPNNRRLSPLKIIFYAVLFFFVGAFTLVLVLIQNTIGFRNSLTVASNFISAPRDKVEESGGRANILIMGKAGGEYGGTDLTDTMIVASIALSSPSVSLVSIPRDLWIPEIRAKVNSAYYWGKQRDEGGIPFAKVIVEKVIGTPIHYGIVVDFSSFREIIDAIGGIEVNVERGFTDKLYPITGRENDLCGGDLSFGCRYETVTFSPGIQKMNGETALKYVRSRMAEGDEGTDQARELRQQKVIEAIKNRTLEPEVLLNPKRIIGVFRIVENSVETDIDLPTGAILVRRIWEAGGSINQYLIPDELLIHPPVGRTYDNQYVLIPRSGNGNWREITAWILEGPLSPGE